MLSSWSSDVVGKLHQLKVSKKQLASLTGYSVGYISMLLNDKRDTKNARNKIELILNELEKELKSA